jgi:signal transduction histidine kinase
MVKPKKKISKPPTNNGFEDYFSSVKNELRSVLLVVHRGMSQLLDGIDNKDPQKCYESLKLVLKNIKELDILIGQLINTSRFELALEKYKSNVEVTKDDVELFKKELIGVISHVIRTPLTVIKEGLALTIEEIPGRLNPKQKEILSKVKGNTDRLVGYIERIFKSSWEDTLKTIGSEVYYQSIIRNNKK